MRDTTERDLAIANELGKMADSRIKELEDALRFCRDMADEEYVHAKMGSGAEIAFRHIARKARETLGE